MKLTFTLTDDNDKVLSSETMAGPGVAIGFDVAEKWRLTQFGDDGETLKYPNVLSIFKSQIADTVGRMADVVGSDALKPLRDAKAKAEADLEAAKAALIAAVKA